MQWSLSSDKEKTLNQKMQHLGINETDIEETFVRSSGPGGQNVNKVATCVCLYYRPKAIWVKCQEFRLQAENRFWARVRLMEKIEQQLKDEALFHQQMVEKKKRQSRKKPQSLKEKILKNKRFLSDKKISRKKVFWKGEE